MTMPTCVGTFAHDFLPHVPKFALDLALSYGTDASSNAWKANWSVIPPLVYLEGVSWHDLPFPGDTFNLLLAAGTPLRLHGNY